MRLLVVEDNAALADGISHALRNDGFAVDLARDGEDAAHILTVQDYDLIVLDLNLPGKDGLSILKGYRAAGGAAQVLILTARDTVDDRVIGLDHGADDYLTKPFELVELEARVRALLRRITGQKSPVMSCGSLAFDTVARRVSINGMKLNLPRRELCLLEVLMGRSGHVISKDHIAERLASFDEEISPNAVEIYVSRLRKRFQPYDVTIKTVRGLGYLMDNK